MVNVLLVCTANVCRSPVAEYLWRQRAAEQGRPAPVSSAGTEAQPGGGADPVCIELLGLRGVDLRPHRTRRMNAAEHARADLILVMEPTHAQRIRSLAPVLAGRVHLLGRWSCGVIADPHGAALEQYQQCISDISAAIDSWLQRI